MSVPTRPRIREAAERVAGILLRTPLEGFDVGDARVDLRLKLECLQETGSFKARGAWNNLCLLDADQRLAGVVATSSGNHGRALAWAAARAGVKATVVMPRDAYPNKIAACRELGAEVVLGRDRPDAEAICRELVEAGATLVHPFDEERTVQGAGTVGLEIVEDWPEVEVVVVPVGGGGLIAGIALAVDQELGARVAVVGAEPEGAPTMRRALAAGHPVEIDPITTSVQGLCPLAAGELNTAICSERVRAVATLPDAAILAAQRDLVVRGGWTVEPAGAAAFAGVREGAPELGDLLEGRGPANPLRVAVVVSGGNPDPEQLRGLREEQGGA